MRTPSSGARMGACEPTPQIVRAFSSPDPAPVLASFKVVRPAGRSTLTPAAAGRHRQREKQAPTTAHTNSGAQTLLRLLTRPDPMGAALRQGE
jgi:hypothetical protein